VVSKIDPHRLRIANDKHPYLIAMWKALQEGWVPPDVVTEDDYKRIKQDTSDPALHGFVGFGLSYSGKWWGGYCRNSVGFDYTGAAKRGCIRKANSLVDVVFTNQDYTDVQLPDNSVIYCDIPYKDTTHYCKSLVGVFDHEEFWQWCKQKVADGHTVFVSEYLCNVPDDAEIVWTRESRKAIRNKDGVQEHTTEVVYTFNKENSK
jgi:DNA adenine methylase